MRTHPVLLNSSLNDSEIFVLDRIVKSDYNGRGWVHSRKYLVFAASSVEGAGHEKLEEDWEVETGTSKLLCFAQNQFFARIRQF